MRHLKIVQGVRVPLPFPDDAVLSALAYEPRPGDTFIVSYPKCGTTWVQYIVYSILHAGVPFDHITQLLVESPFLELCGAEVVNLDPRPPTIKTHLPFDEKRFSPFAKYIYIVRNPYDVCVSGYHQAKTQTLNDGGNLDIGTYVRNFVEGTGSYGRYFEDSLLPWYRHRRDSNVLFLTYEDLHADIENQLKRIAYFLGEEYGERISSDPGLLQRVIDMTTKERMRPIFRDYIKANFEFMVQQRTRRGIAVPEPTKELLDFLTCNTAKHDFVREGAVKGNKNILLDAHKEILREWILSKTVGSDVLKIWSTAGVM
ncbi:sulfotransferase ssu-1-like [Haemaphysalis longicornis]